jgi:hypothetical protein
MSKLFKDVSKMLYNLNVIQQYSNFRQLGDEEDIIYLRDKVNNLYNIKDSVKLVEEFTWCAKMVNSYYAAIDSEFKHHCLQEEIKRTE